MVVGLITGQESAVQRDQASLLAGMRCIKTGNLEGMVMNSRFAVAGLAVVLIAVAGPAQAQTSLPIPDHPAARDVPGAHLLPDPGMVHKVVFDVAAAAESVGDVNPGLAGVARYVNTLAQYGVPAENRKIAVVLHRGSTPVILNSAAFKARNDGLDNPNIALIRSLDAAGVEFHVCGQAVLGNEIDPQDMMPEIQLDLWALTTLIDLGLQGYVRIGG